MNHLQLQIHNRLRPESIYHFVIFFFTFVYMHVILEQGGRHLAKGTLQGDCRLWVVNPAPFSLESYTLSSRHLNYAAPKQWE